MQKINVKKFKGMPIVVENKIVDYWKFTVKTQYGIETIKIDGYEVATLAEAKQAARGYGKIINYITIFLNIG